ncbi:MAG: DUF922 domain-containing protein [Candidatus Saccharimonadales bacterium]
MLHRGGTPVVNGRYSVRLHQRQSNTLPVSALVLVVGMLLCNLVRIGVDGQWPQNSLAPVAYATPEETVVSTPVSTNTPATELTAQTTPEATPSAATVPASLPKDKLVDAKSVTAPVVPMPRSCTGTPYIMAGALQTAQLKPGLTQVVDSPHYYTVYGSTLQEVRSAISSCSLRQNATPYHASTAYALNWSYNFALQNGTCSVTDVRVGLHVNQFLPNLGIDTTTPAPLAQAWSVYAQNLALHENGHTAITVQYAQKLTAALESSSALPCDSVSAQTKTLTDSYVTMLNAANELYDSQTNHGATQGALL